MSCDGERIDIELEEGSVTTRGFLIRARDGTAINLANVQTMQIVWRAIAEASGAGDRPPDGGADAMVVADPAIGRVTFAFDVDAMRLVRGVKYRVKFVAGVAPTGTTGRFPEGAALIMRVHEKV